LEAIIQETNGPDLDYTIRSLRLLGHWYVELAREDYTCEQWARLLGWDERPPSDITSEQPPPKRNLSITLSAVAGCLEAYCAEVDRRLISGARWVCWRGGYADDPRNGQLRLDVGDPTNPHGVGAYTFLVLNNSYEHQFRPDAPGYEPPNPGRMADLVATRVLERHEFVERNGSPVWQVAPTGPRAFEGRHPMRRVPARLMDAYRKGEIGMPTVHRGPEPPPDPDPQVGMG
jgi:hypothetical protein